jgi:acyl carrier protein
VDDAGQEKVILAAETGRHTPDAGVHEIASAVRLALAQYHEVELAGLVLLPPRSLPRTSSGKTQRAACRKAYLEGTLDPIAVWTPAPLRVEDAAGELENVNAKPRTAPAIEAWLVALLVRRKGSPDRVDAHTPFASCGLDSMAAVGLAAELEASLAFPVSPTLVYEHPTPRALAAHLSRQMADPVCATAAPPALELEQRARLVAEVERLSENDAAELLAAEVTDRGQV